MNFSFSNKRDIIKLLDALLTTHGFVRTKDDWYLDNQECVSVFGLGKSFYGGQFSLSMGILLKELRPQLLPFPPYHLCHFRGFALEFLMPNQTVLKAALNLENDISNSERVNSISVSINKYALPFILPLNSKQVIAQKIKTDEDFEPYCNLELKLALESGGYLNRDEMKLDLL